MYNKKLTETQPKQNTEPHKIEYLDSALNQINNLINIANRKKHKYIKIRTRAAYLVILLLMAGDILPNPGPSSTHCPSQQPVNGIKSPENIKTYNEEVSDEMITSATCLRCQKEEENVCTGITCETCHGWFHVKCSTQEGSKLSNPISIENSFEWICPNHYCKPNHWPGIHLLQNETPNRYNILGKTEDKTERKEREGKPSRKED